MEFQHFIPSGTLKPYMKHYYIFKSEPDIEFDDIVCPGGDMEMIFSLGQGTWQSSVENKFFSTAKIEKPRACPLT